jgi:DnaJ homolog subfamily B member 6
MSKTTLLTNFLCFSDDISTSLPHANCFDNFRLMTFPVCFTKIQTSHSKCLNFRFLFIFAEKKRRIYDQYGKEGLIGHNEANYSNNHHRRRHTHDPFENDFIFGGGFPFVFRDPEEVFREFFGGSPFDEIFNPGHGRRHQNGNAGGSRHHHHRSSHPQNVMSPFMSFSLMDDMFAPHAFGGLSAMNGGFTSLSTFNGSMGGGGGGNVKRISTSTSFVNGKKVVTKK